MDLIDAIENYSEYKSQPNNQQNWFEHEFQHNKLSLNDIVSFSSSAQPVLEENQPAALSFFLDYQQFFEDNPKLRRDYYLSYFRAKKKCFDFALNLGKDKCAYWNDHIIEWVRVCYNAANDKEIDFFLRQESIEQEYEIRRAIFCDDKKTNLREEFKQRLAPYLESLAEWFLKRYDLVTAYKIINKIAWSKSSERKGLSYKIPWILLIISFLLFADFFMWYFDKSNLIIWDSIHLIKIKDVSFFVCIESLVCFMILALLMFFLIDFTSNRKTTLYFKLLIPRLLGGIFIGYFPILIGEEVWTFVKEINAFETFFIVILSSGFSLYYLFTELNNVVKDIHAAFFRSVRIWLIGLIESFIVGIVIQDLFARAFFNTLEDYSLQVSNGLLGGNIYPKVLLIYFPLALFIGIFVQLIWEDKPITHPL